MAAATVVRVGAVGAGFMGRVYSLALRTAPGLAPEDLPTVELARVADPDGDAAEHLRARWGWRDAVADWRAVTRAPDVDLVLVLTPNHLHAEVALDALARGKHVLCEKPLAHTPGAARRMAAAALTSGRVHQVGFVYRGWPAVALARELLAAGEIGEPLRYRGWYHHDFALDPAMPWSWRLDRAASGGGAGADIGSHVIDMARSLVGEVDAVAAQAATHHATRPLPGGGGKGRPVEVEEASDLLVRFASGVQGVLQTSWVAGGHKTDIGFELFASRGSLEFSWNEPYRLRLYRAGDPAAESGAKSIVVGPAHPGGELFWPVAGQGLGFAAAFQLAVRDLLLAVSGRPRPGRPDFLDGLRAAEVVETARSAAETGTWRTVERTPPDELSRPAGPARPG